MKYDHLRMKDRKEPPSLPHFQPLDRHFSGTDLRGIAATLPVPQGGAATLTFKFAASNLHFKFLNLSLILGFVTVFFNGIRLFVGK